MNYRQTGINTIAEIGINHKGSLRVAKKLIDQAVETRCWGVKFQYRDLESFYKTSDEIGDGIIIEELKRINFSIDNFIELANYAKEKNINVGVSFFRIEDVKIFSKAIPFFDFFKVPSAECTNTELIKELLSFQKKVMISTGGHTEKDIKNALTQFNDKDVVIFHCIANYPSKIGVQNINFIDRLYSFGFSEVGYSSHDEHIGACLMAMTKGINWIERHLTEDVGGEGLDDSSSSTYKDFETLDLFSKNIQGIMGSQSKILNQGEILNMQNLGTGLYAKKDLNKNQKYKVSDFDIRAPRKGLSVGDFLEKFYDKKIEINISRAAPLEKRSFSKPKKYNKEQIFKYANSNKVGIPVRLHDFLNFQKNINVGVYEFHLSYQESMQGNFLNTTKLIKSSDHISIHLPDYLPGNRIIDPVSDDKEIRSESRSLISNIVSFAEIISDKISKSVPIVGSFSQTNNRPKQVILDDIFSFLEEKEFNKYNILPQWLPVYAWYFGGAVKLDLFNSLDDINYIVKNNKSICLDLCHLSLSANYAGADWRDWYKLLMYNSPHLHLADAEGSDGEGLQLGEGNIGNFQKFLNLDGMKIIEVWQAHFNDGEGFLKALSILEEGRKV